MISSRDDRSLGEPRTQEKVIELGLSQNLKGNDRVWVIPELKRK